ncbi:flavodoxin domain-containing protein [Terrihalobacillus insolitus]|uniref:flavodoxin domain-containing protein n=1 Tax=Terrihalobacillus insolitus TaxID=2950438 RepID=UPI00233F8A3C|nr:flavodoxin domain-containing protein [Terrihalobacillus insolitus]MDC3413935.1 flavodoxin domain-containing protein [Terrihalobacillus insolitus]
MKSAIVFTTISGNTQEVAELITETITKNGGECDLFHTGRFAVNLSLYDIVFFGSYTWGDGKLPVPMRKELKRILIDDKDIPKLATVFGTGDTNYHFFCRAVDEMEYHLNKHGVETIGSKLKIEQSCRGSQEQKVIEWTNQILNGVIDYETSKN